jgi:hypothetical protein
MSFCKIGKCLVSAPKRTLGENRLNPLIGKQIKADTVAASARFGTVAASAHFGTVAATTHFGTVAASAYFGNTSPFDLPLA